jgi:hypothetical protein
VGRQYSARCGTSQWSQKWFKAAGKGFRLGLYDGVTGIFTQPVKGAKEGGVAGFVGGFFKGIGGAACKPAAGKFLALPFSILGRF